MEIIIKKAENGFIIIFTETGQEYIFPKWSQVMRHLREWSAPASLK